MGARGNISVTRKRLWRKQNGRCHYCKTHMVRTTKPHPDAVTVDHIIPKCDGGTRQESNILGACWTCNNARGSMPYAAFCALIATRGRPAPTIGDVPPASIRAWLERREIKRVDRAEKAAALQGSWGNDRMGADRPYLTDIAKYPTLAEALSAAGAVPESLNDELVAVRERWGT